MDADSTNGGAPALSTLSVLQLDAPWTDDAGATRHLAEWRGHPVVIAMFFASCGFACPATVADMRKIEATLPAAKRRATRFVLVTFDPARDTVAALQAYRERLELGAEWTLLRGDAGAIQDLAAVLGVKFKRDASGQFAHSNLITVLNTEGEIALQRTGLKSNLAPAVQAVIASLDP
jgi:protein SCO1/2